MFLSDLQIVSWPKKSSSQPMTTLLIVDIIVGLNITTAELA